MEDDGAVVEKYGLLIADQTGIYGMYCIILFIRNQKRASMLHDFDTHACMQALY